MNNFSAHVLKITKRIPKGKVATYSQIAKLIKRPKAYRIVGQALKQNPTPVTISCHRVVRFNGTLGGYAQGINRKIELLKEEGIKIHNGKIDLGKYGWQQS